MKGHGFSRAFNRSPKHPTALPKAGVKRSETTECLPQPGHKAPITGKVFAVYLHLSLAHTLLLTVSDVWAGSPITNRTSGE